MSSCACDAEGSGEPMARTPLNCKPYKPLLVNLGIGLLINTSWEKMTKNIFLPNGGE